MIGMARYPNAIFSRLGGLHSLRGRPKKVLVATVVFDTRVHEHFLRVSRGHPDLKNP
jgi:hypothetical protein